MKLKAASGYACYVKDLNKTAEFYEKLGLQIKTRSSDRLIVYLNWYRIDFVALDKENKPDIQKEANLENKGAGIFLCFSVDNVDETYKKILSLGLKPLRLTHKCGKPQVPSSQYNGDLIKLSLSSN
jgi:predicted lactoylglutathione lyase